MLCSRTPEKESSLDQGEAVRGLHRPQERLYIVLCLRGGLLGGSLILANLENDHGFIRNTSSLV